MTQYLEALHEIRYGGVDRKGRNGWTRAQFAKQLRFDMRKGFPAVTTKTLAFKAVVAELLWFLSGSTNDNDLKKLVGKNKTIWTANAEDPKWVERRSKDLAYEEGSLGKIYGHQWRNWNGTYLGDRRVQPRSIGNNDGVDQITRVVDLLRKDPYDRRAVVTAWNPSDLDHMALPPCHMLFQFFAANGFLSLHMVQRSCDMFLGVPFNIASYALLLSMVAKVVCLEPLELVITLNDAHIYHDHFHAVDEQLQREPRELPKLVIANRKDIFDFVVEDFSLEDYDPLPSIKAEMIL